MWKQLLSLDEKGSAVIAKLPADYSAENAISKEGISEALDAIGASKFYIDNDAIECFIRLANETKKEAYQGQQIAEKRNAQLSIELEEQDMIANMRITGAYGGRGARGSDVIHELAKGHITKGINKNALKKVLAMSVSLAPGEEYIQPVAQGKPPLNGEDTQFVPLVEDYSKRVLAPQKKENSEKLDMKNLGETITVGQGDHLMKRVPATKGEPGFSVTGKELSPTPGKDSQMKAGKGTEISKSDPNLLIASMAGLPIIKGNTVDVENAMCIKDVGVATGHVKFKGCLVITGNVEPGMIVRATGSITVGGFIESADVQAQGDITVAKGIIGHTVSEDEAKTCIVKSGQSITANYAQYSELQAHKDISLDVHSISNDIRCGNTLTVLDDQEKHGTLSGGAAKVGGKVVCFNLGVEGDTATYIEAFARYPSLKERLQNLKDSYKVAQDEAMNAVRKELEWKKKPKEERFDDDLEKVLELKKETNAKMLSVKNDMDATAAEIDGLLLTTTIDVKNHVYTHVTVQFGDEKVITKREHGPSLFSFNQHEIHCSSTLDENDLADSDATKEKDDSVNPA